MHSCYLYRLPNTATISGGHQVDEKSNAESAAMEIEEQIEAFDGLLYSDFSLNPELQFIRCDYFIEPGKRFDDIAFKNDSLISNSPGYSVGKTTPREKHIDYVETLIQHINKIEQGKGLRSKIIGARVKVVDTDLSPSEIFLRLCEAYPSAFVYAFSTPETGTWIGATPEKLLWATEGDSDYGRIETVALAGTRKSTENDIDIPWGIKEIEEQQIVTDFITKTLSDNGYRPLAEHPLTVKCGPVEHISTSISAERNTDGRSEIINLLRILSPTPALSGYPRKFAMQAIEKNESFPRELYGGIVGVIKILGLAPKIYAQYSVMAFANLRCGHLNSCYGEMRLYAGGGITRDSDPVAEWEETEAKLTTLTNIISDAP